MAATSMLAGLRPDDCESPDFIVRDGGQVLGIEVTEFAYPEQPGYPNTREQSSLRSRVIQDAYHLYTRLDGPPLHVSVTFSDYRTLTKRRAPELAEELAEFLSGYANKSLLTYGSPAWPEASLETMKEIAQVTAIRVPDGCSSWSTGYAGWPRRAGYRDIMRTIARKENKLQRYAQACSAVWLLVVFTHQFAGDPTRAPMDPPGFVVRSDFDRIFCFDRVTGRSIEIPRSRRS